MPGLTLVLGGAASGKSVYAEKLCQASGLQQVYVATAASWDAEMEAKIFRHRARRGQAWRVIEAQNDLPGALARAPSGAVILVDCVTMWLSNRMLAGADLAAEGAELIRALGRAPGPVVAVTNEVGHGVVPEHALGRAFREAQGDLNHRLAAHAGSAIFIVAGLALALKGALPELPSE